MKKSKFLKKSLAMLLAVMLVVAMIPLSAAASDPNLYQVWAEVDGERALLSQDGNTFTGSYKAGAQEVTLQIVVGTGNLVYYTNMDDGQAVDTNIQLGQGGNPAGVAEVELDVDLYTNDEGNFEVNFAVVDEDVPSDRKSYKLVLEPKVLSTETRITGFELNRVQGNTIPNWETAQIGVDFVSVTMPYDAINSDITTYQIRNMSISDGATWTITRDSVQVATGDSTGVVSGVNMTDNQPVTVEDGDVIAISNNGRTARYTLHISVADGFTYFQTAEGLDAVKFSDTGDIVVLLPFGTAADADGGDITVTPIFELDYPSATAYWGDDELNGVDDAITVDADDVVDGEDDRGTTYRSFEGTSDQDWTGRKNAITSTTTFATFASTGLRAAKAAGHGEQITIRYADEAERTYNVYFCETRLNNATTIDELVIGSEVAEIDEENATIDITLPNGTNLASVNLSNASNTTEATMTAAFGADIDFVIPSLAWTGSGPRSATQTFAADSTPVDLRQPVSVRVLSQDNSITGNEKVYTLNVNASSEYQEAEITSFTLKNEALDYFFTGTPDQNGQVIMKVPYEIYDEILLGGNGWQFFYTKTVGTLATVNGETLPVSGRTIPTFSDGDNSLFDIIFPDVLSPESKVTSAAEGGAIEVRMIGEDLTENSMRYRLVLQRVPAKTESQLDSFSLVGKRAWEVPGCSTTYLGTVTQPKTAGNGNTGSIVANTSWTAAQYWTGGNTMNAIAEVVEDSNARVFFKGTASNGQVYYMQLVNFGDTSAKNAVVEDVTSTANHWILHEDTEVVVLSEEFWVELLEDGAFTASQNDPNGSWFTVEAFNNVANGSNGSHYTIYTLNLNDDVHAEEGATLKELTLMDGTGWTDTLTVDAEEHHLVGADGKIPYALTSDLDADGNLIDNGTDTSVNPVFLTYDFNPGNRAYVLATDTSLTGDWANMTTAAGTNRVPTAGDDTVKGGATYPVSGDGVFYDLDALDNEDWTEDKFETYESEGLPFLLISREGKVYVYHWDDTDGFV